MGPYSNEPLIRSKKNCKYLNHLKWYRKTW
jgi:hypothetical protein